MPRELFIGGDWVAGAGARIASVDPGSGEMVWKGAGAAPNQVESAIAAARKAFSGWANAPVEDRAAIARRFAKAIERRADLLAETISRSMGKPLWESRTEVASVVGKVDISIRMRSIRAGEQEEKTAFGAMTLAHRPHGVVAVFGPFNFPAHLPNGHIAPALLAGDTVVFKPSELAPAVGSIMCEAWEEAGLPPGVLNMVQGAHETGAALLAHPDINGVLFTGSSATGLMIHRQFAGRPDVLLALEMGGNNPLIVWPPSDARAAANLIAHSAWATSGQRCSCARRLILPQGAFGEEVLARLKALGEGLSAADWRSRPEPFMGPVVSVRAAERASAAEAELASRGGRSVLAFARRDAMLRPAIIDMTGAEAPPDEEVFAPLIQVFRVRTIEEAFARASATRYGLSGGLISDDPALWAQARAEMRVGVLNWNRPTTGASSAQPFGGRGFSGNLRPSAAYAADYCAYPVASQTAPAAVAIAAQGLPA
jgi:succinylglutamic semialdehyde dehydrogenase